MKVKISNKIKFIIFAVSLVLLWYLGSLFHLDTSSFERSLQKFPVFYSGAIFVFLYCLVTFFIWFSKDFFRVMAAVLYGPYISTVFVFVAETINAFILFYFARYLGREFVEKNIQNKYRNLDKKLGQISFGWLLLFRTAPFLPFRFMDLAAGLTRIEFKKYLLAVALGSPVRIFWLQFALSGIGKKILNNPYSVMEFLQGNKGFFIFSALYLILVIVVAVKLKRRT